MQMIGAALVFMTVALCACIALSESELTASTRIYVNSAMDIARLVDGLPDCQCIGECDTTTATGLHYCVIGDNPECKGAYGRLAVDSIDGSTGGDGLYEAYCGIIFGHYDCGSDPCQNGGFCIDGMDAYTCVCPAGFTGLECEQDIDECGIVEDHPCVENAGCSNTVGSFTCDCLSGYSGGAYAVQLAPDPLSVEGERRITESQEGVRLGGMTSVEIAEQNKQTQDDGVLYGGCLDLDDCASQPCLNGAQCSNAGANLFKCECTVGWIGVQCEVDVNECEDGTDNCDEDAACMNQPGGFLCSCNSGFEGDGVQGTFQDPGTGELLDHSGCKDIDDCTNSPCLNDATCNDAGENAFMCACASGWEGIICDRDANECRDGTHDCDFNASCENTEGGYICDCNAGWVGDGATCQDGDDCTTAHCRNGSTCIDQGTSLYSCVCADGWMGVECEVDQDECAGEGGCHPDAMCTNTLGSYVCQCGIGFEGDGVTACSDINDCASHPCVHGSCEDLGANIYKCNCENGYKDTDCDMDVDECIVGSHTCHPKATCLNAKGTYHCKCMSGYEGDGHTSCRDVDDCVLSPCVHGTCVDTGPNAYKCQCEAGWTDTICDYDVDECGTLSHECYPNATCSNTQGSYICTCNAGYDGDGRQECMDIDDCSSSPCGNGTCENVGPNQYMCTCEDGWKDTNCDFDVNECAEGGDNECMPGAAQCINVSGSYQCRCLPGWEGDGRSCEDVDDCSPDPCMFGTCTDKGPNKHVCDCTEGWQSDACDVDIDECIDAAHACDIRATCTNEQGSYTCQCNEQFYGDGTACYPCSICEEGYEADSPCGDTDRTCRDVDECASETHNCHSEAMCHNEDGTFVCTCREGFFGDGVRCNECKVCGAGYREEESCTATHDAKCDVQLKDGLYTISSEADGARKCLMFSADGANQYPERYNFGSGDEWCGIPTMNNMSKREALIQNRQALWKLKQLEKDIYTLESNADGQGWQCLRFGMGGRNQYPDRHNWGEGRNMCGYPAETGASARESLVADGEAVFKLQRLDCAPGDAAPCGDGGMGGKFLIMSNAGHTGWQCMIFGGHGYATNPMRHDWGNGDELCGAGHWNGMPVRDAVLENKQAVWILDFVAPCPNESC